MRQSSEPSPVPSKSSSLELSLTELRGVGLERMNQLGRLGIQTIGDLLLHRPNRYEDRRRIQSIRELQLGQAGTICAQIVALGVKRFAHGRKSVFEMILDDGTARLHCRWWNLPYLQNYYEQGQRILVFGKLNSLKPRTIDHPDAELVEGTSENSIHLNRIAPIYPLTEGLPQRWLRALVWQALEEFGERVAEPWPNDLAPDFNSRSTAIRSLHFPAEQIDAVKARARLALDELVEFQEAIRRRRRALQAAAQARPCGGDNRFIQPFLAQLGFKLTQAQISVLQELRRDMARGEPMRRLVQGDVGSGKTVVAACCALLALESSFSVALMAPTEILAEQHYRNFSRWFTPLGIEVRLQSGSRKTSERPDELVLPLPGAQMNTAIRPTPPSSTPTGIMVVGTHALLEASFSLDNLGLVVIDEQHRFGVAQREGLVRKGAYPHLLVMTATPIPRTLGLTLYGDLDISIIRELPSGRAPVRTFVRSPDRVPKVWEFIRAKLGEGRQAFVIFPRVEETGQEIKSVVKEFENLQKIFAPFPVGLLHGRMGSDQKDQVMQAFRANTVKLLVSTSLVEVGIDVPNATIMVVENAEQFGLAQLHQLRGRIGRGTHESYCILITRAKTQQAQQRLQILEETADGFQIAEADLKLRGPGDLLGPQQSGLPPFRFADLVDDFPLVERARDLARILTSSSVGSDRLRAADGSGNASARHEPTS